MVPKSSDKRTAAILKETITLLCKNSIAFKRKCTIEAVVGITVDDNNVILVSMSELVRVASSNCGLAGEKKDSSDKQGKPCTDKPEEDDLDLDISVTDSPGVGQAAMQEGELLDLDISVTDSPGVAEAALELTDEESKSSTDLVFVKREMVDQRSSGSTGAKCYTGLMEQTQVEPVKVQPAFGMIVQPINLQQQQQSWPSASYYSPTSPQPTAEVTKHSSANKNLKTVQRRPGRKRQKQQQQKPEQQQQKGELLKGSKSKQFKCKHCQKCFAGKWYLEMHEKTHRGIYPFTCDVCSKGVLTSGHLRMHLDRHKRETKQNINKTDTVTSSSTKSAQYTPSEQAFSPIIVDVVSQSLLDKT